jgi:cytochrome b561
MTLKKYPLPMRVFHWTISMLIFGMLIVGFLMTGWLSEKPFTGDLFWWHKSFGVLILGLVLLRMLSRVVFHAGIPPLPQSFPASEKILAGVVHKALYLMLLVMPLSGYLMSSFHPKSSGVSLFSLQLPVFLPKNEALAGVFKEIHDLSAWILLALIALHILGVIKHRFFDKPEHDVLGRML